MRTAIYLISLWCFILLSCSDSSNDHFNKGNILSDNFKSYWHSGKAEVAAYDLEQARYGEIHKGHAVLIFVTEDFSKSKHVKLDNPQKSEDDKINVLKMNFTKKFNTGIYPYSIMMSVFSPVDIYNYPKPLKVAMSAQEWCGQVFTQLNLGNNAYEALQYSYFESEGDKSSNIDLPALLEDEIWNRIRLDYKTLPTGKINILPGTITSRFTHSPLEITEAEAITKELENNIIQYSITYSGAHKLSIRFDKNFPHQILGWEETFMGFSGELLTTKATLSKTLYIDYWTKNKNEHLYLRDSLGLGL